ncbi:hypothetical protein DV737_g5089, partial [Chaetothyriales sp. CBS 132003]
MFIRPHDATAAATAVTVGLVARSSASSDARSESVSNASTPTIIGLAVVTALVIAVVAGYSLFQRLRAGGQDPKLAGSSFFRRRWGSWAPGSKYRQVTADGRGSQDSGVPNTGYGGAAAASHRGLEVEERAAGQAVAAGVDRNTSVRSVMTLPAYQQSPKEGEQVLGREGERAGMDTVVEFPETQEEEEVRREEQMDSLYQIRLARRREMAEREERRRQRQEARSRGDLARLEELRQDDNLNAGLSTSAATLIAEHQSRGRDRRVSSVAYADVGHVRHDGTRLRANSAESERGALLAGAAPMGQQTTGRARGASDAASLLSQPQPAFRRQRSGSSALSISTTASDLDHAAAGRPRAGEHADADRPARSSHSNADRPHRSSHSIATSASSPTGLGLTPQSSPWPRPPEYEQLEWGHAPAYSEHRHAPIGRNASNASQRAFDDFVRFSQAPQLPELRLPSIHVEGATEPNTPVSPTVGVPAHDADRRRAGRRGDRDEDWDEA